MLSATLRSTIHPNSSKYMQQTKKATVMSVDGRVDGDELPEGIKDVLLRLTRETFSEHTMLVTIERVRKVGARWGARCGITRR